MSMYRCKIGTSDGRVLEKEFEAASREALRENLEEQGFFVFKISKVSFQWLSASKSLRRFTGQRLLALNQEMQVLIRSGLPILQVLDTLIDRMESGRLLEILREIRSDVKGGSSLSDAFERFQGAFPQLYIASIRAGEQSGDLPVTLGRFIEYQKRIEMIKSKVRSATFYPALLAIAVTVVVAFLMLYVVPSFTQVYTDANVELPVLTQLIISLANLLVSGLPVWLPALIAVLIGLRFYFRTDSGAFFLDRYKLRLPFFGKLLSEYAISTFCRTFATTLSSGIPIVHSMQMARGTLNNRWMEHHLTAAVKRIQEGTKISEALEQSETFPIIALRMIGVGETSGSLAEMLSDIAEYYEREVERRLDRLTTMIEPVMMLTMGLLIGAIVVAMYIPIFQLAGTVR
ncbi:MAG: type II secretion system F family protein [Deltaproteobacteria bacterium]|nr:type II secretion system F family protein [Deltaproteobacteria bacterium]MBW2475700.1 type II secretion system F family protein [Deltaproteobacteria bacterium]